MRLRGWLGVGALLLAGVGATPAAAVTFGAAVIGPVGGSPFAAAGVIGVAPVPRAWALTLTRVVDQTSARLAAARAAGTQLRSVGLAWSAAGPVQSVCLDDVAVTSYARRAVPGAKLTVEHLTLYYAALTRAAGVDACRRRVPPRPVVVRLLTDPAGALHARVDCLLARCAGALRLLCPNEGCPRAGVRVGRFTLGPGQVRMLPIALGRSVRGRHPKLIAAVTLDGTAAPIVGPVAVDPPPPPPLPSLLAGAPSSSAAPTPAPPPGSAPAGAPGPGSGPAGPGGGPGAPLVPDGGPVLGGPSSSPPPAPGGGPLATTLTLTCGGPVDAFTSVRGLLGPALAGKPVEVDYIPVDQSAATIIHNVTTGAGGRFTDAAGAPFVSAIAFFPGDDGYVAADAYCPM